MLNLKVNICILIVFFTQVCTAQIWVDLKTHEMMYINEDLNEYLYSKGDGKFIKMNLLNKLKTDDIMFCHLNLNLYFGNDKSKIYNIKVFVASEAAGMYCENPDGTSQNFMSIGKGKKLSYNELLQDVFLTDFEDSNTKEKMKFYLSKGKLAVDYSPNGSKWMNCSIVSGSLQERQIGIKIPGDNFVYKLNLNPVNGYMSPCINVSNPGSSQVFLPRYKEE